MTPMSGPLKADVPQRKMVDVGKLIDESRFSSFQMFIVGLCVQLSMIEGFDTQAIAFAAPAIAAEWKFSPSLFGFIFSIGLFGAVLGAMGVGMIQDSIGRRPTLIVTIAAFSFLTFLTSFARSFDQMLLFRLLAGIGLGAAVPIFFSYASEFSPGRIRTTMVATTVAAFPFGAVVGGIMATPLIGAYGWRSIFWMGGLGPLLLIPVVWAFLPETIRFLAIHRGSQGEIIAILRKIDPTLEFDDDTVFTLDELKISGAKFPALFMKALLPGTILLPLALFSSLLLTDCLLNWLPILLHQFGFTVQRALYGSILYNFASIAGSLVLTRLIDRIGRALLVLGIAYIVGCTAVCSVGLVGTSFWAVMLMIFVAGLFAAGPQLSLTAFIANFYPTAIRGTGIGWGQGIGRIGSLTGPLVGGYLLSLHAGMPALLMIVSVSALLSAAALLTLLVFFKQASAAATGGVRDRTQDEALLKGDPVPRTADV
jgi:AAHS family 4-hydroxybenzoate transporter-like MFS transporter